ncbi:MAG TPA: response regulator [Candidatus Aminicenantes bacterium]|nr:response regulator [Candidatus Aminicenantes bacterium]
MTQKKDSKEKKRKEKKRDEAANPLPSPIEQKLTEINNQIKKNLWGLEQNRLKVAKLIELSLAKIDLLKKLFQDQQKLEEDLEKQRKTNSTLAISSQAKNKPQKKFLNYLKNCEEKLKQFNSLLATPASTTPPPRLSTLQAAKIKPTPKKDQKKKILIIEDEAIIIKSVSYFLVNAGFEVLFALNPQEGLQKAEEEQPSLILLDIVMPGLNGYQVLAQLKKNKSTAHIPVIILSALSRESDILEGLERGANDYLTKPFSPEILLSKIKKVLSEQNDNSNLHRSL